MKLIRLNFWLNTVENSSLLGVTCISNKENYPIHEKIFIVFMEQRSYYWKKVMFAGIMSATAGLLFFFYKHRIHCEPGGTLEV
nr:hypothetical protein BaRGS_026114 [Batillaria attramentaria]